MNNLSIKNKLLLLSTMALAVIFAYSLKIADDAYTLYTNSTKTHNIVELSIKVSTVLHELQKERGASTGFLDTQGKSFAKILLAQQIQTDKKIKELRDFCKKYLTPEAEIVNKINLNLIKEIRKKISSQSINTKIALDFYTSLNKEIIDDISFFSTIPKDTEVRTNFSSFILFISAKEKAGVERAILSGVFAIDKFTLDSFAKFSSLAAEQQTLLNLFINTANNKIKSEFKHIQKNSSFLEVQRIRNIALLKNKNFGIDSVYWFKIITKKIEKLKEFEDKITYYTISKANDKANEAFTTLIILTLVTTAILLFILYVSYYVTNEITKAYVKLEEITKNQEIIIVQKTKIANEQRDSAINSAKAKSEFLANMSHEIRTPLNAILGFVDILKDENKGRKSLEYINIIDESSNGLLQIIEDILDFSKIESGKIDIDKIDFNTKQELELISYLFDAKCSQKDINLSIIFDENLPKAINTDPLRIKQIIANLISNAIKFTDAHKNILVSINYTNGCLDVSVKDEGKGISQDKLEHIFEAFSQEDSSTTREFGGTGLGLSISSELVKLLDGELKVKSEIGVGSEFYFSIPVTIGKETIKQKIDSADVSFKNKKILLAEDNKANQMFMKVVFKKMNLNFDIASDGAKTVDMFKVNKYDAVLMDENMPNLNGIGATKEILEYEKELSLPHTPIIALTANALKGDRERFLEAGMDEYMTKPVDRKKLAEILGKFL